jgi:transposase-like protein
MANTSHLREGSDMHQRTSLDEEQSATKVAHEFGMNPSQLNRYCLKGRKLRDGSRLFPEATKTPAGWRLSRRAVQEFLNTIPADARSLTPSRTARTRHEHDQADAACSALGL